MGSSEKREREEAFERAASVLGLSVTRQSASGVIDDFEVRAANWSYEGRSWLEVRVFVDGFPEGLEIRPWGRATRLFNLLAWLPFFTAKRRIECNDGRSIAVIANSADSRDSWLTEENQKRACALRSVLTHEGIYKGPHYLEYRNSKPATEPAQIITAVNKTLEDARQLTN